MTTIGLVLYAVSVVIALLIGHFGGYHEGKKIGDYNGYQRCIQDMRRRKRLGDT